jgi:hypothetical protein
MVQPQDPPIVVSGGSITVDIAESVFTKNGNKHSNANKKIRSVKVEVEGQAPQTFNVPNGKVVVTIEYGNNNQNP